MSNEKTTPKYNQFSKAYTYAPKKGLYKQHNSPCSKPYISRSIMVGELKKDTSKKQVEDASSENIQQQPRGKYRSNEKEVN